MDKRLFFIWFGDKKPDYADWTIENFKCINIGWKIIFIHYTLDQIKNFKLLKDKFLEKSIEQYIKKFGNKINLPNLSDIYRWKILTEEYDTYIDLDTFPICSLDKFITVHNKQYNGYVRPQCLGYTTNRLIDDQWFICNTRKTCININIMYKNINLNDDIIYKYDIGINPSQVNILENRRDDFFNMKLKIGDNFACKFYTPVEHYQSKHRLDKNIKTELFINL